jgi:hypothetical protein
VTGAIGNPVALSPPLEPMFDLVELRFYASSIGWLFIVSIELARIPGYH